MNLTAGYIDDTTEFAQGDMNKPLIDLDQALSCIKNLVILCEKITYSAGTLTWTGITIYFNDVNGNLKKNTVVASNISLASGEYTYVDLSIISDQVLTLAKTNLNAKTTQFNRILLGYREGSIFTLSQSILPLNTAYLISPTAITPGASPYTYQNTENYSFDIIVSGGTVSLIEFTRDNAAFYDTGFIAGILRLSPGDRIRVTYSGVPTMTKIPR